MGKGLRREMVAELLNWNKCTMGCKSLSPFHPFPAFVGSKGSWACLKESQLSGSDPGQGTPCALTRMFKHPNLPSQPRQELLNWHQSVLRGFL